MRSIVVLGLVWTSSKPDSENLPVLGTWLNQIVVSLNAERHAGWDASTADYTSVADPGSVQVRVAGVDWEALHWLSNDTLAGKHCLQWCSGIAGSCYLRAWMAGGHEMVDWQERGGDSGCPLRLPKAPRLGLYHLVRFLGLYHAGL